ncbi:hypothetical protein BG015_011549 [Linnemannia schmuckeri]|uniref:F-box domain-containing protein n=1 Tax=Linnemannia schmuckeri TaxID=64567 RepID=A0A9P5V8A9_9FUNG|nr:hypothetical protein BG015_011549 [Linnemannia schmuckeri]
MSIAFDNTLITDNIFQYLSRRDTTACLKVSKAWYPLAQLHLWRSIVHYYTHRPDDYNSDSSNPPPEWWQPIRDDRFVDAFGNQRPSWTTHSSSPTFISAKQKELICRNAFRIKSLRIDYSAKNLLDVPFGNLTRFSLSCWCSHTKDWRDADPGGVEDRMLKGVALELIARNPRLKELELSYVEYFYSWYGGGTRPLTAFVMRVLQVLQRHHQSSSSLPSLSSSDSSNSGLYSLKPVYRGSTSMKDICSIVENCPPSLQELTIHSYIDAYAHIYTSDPQAIRDRFAAIKNNNLHIHIHNHTLNLSNNYSHPSITTPTNARQTTRTPNLRLLNIAHYDELISILTASCPTLTNINFGENFIAEEHMFRFLSTLPEGQLLGITMMIRPDFLTHVLPTLLERSASTLEAIRLQELDFVSDRIHHRSGYILQILTSCPQLKTLVVVPSRGLHSNPCLPNLLIHDLLQEDWVCSELKTLSNDVLDLAAPSESTNLDRGKNVENEAETTSPYNPELAIYKCKIQILASFYSRLKSRLPLLSTLDFQWSKSCKNIPYDCAVEYSNSLLTVDNLRWMGLRWWTIYGLKTTAVREALGALSEKESNLFEEHRWQGMGIYVRTDEDERRRRQREAKAERRTRWRVMYCCCSDDGDLEDLSALCQWEME